MSQTRLDKAVQALRAYWNSRGSPEIVTGAMAMELDHPLCGAGRKLEVIEQDLVPMDRSSRDAFVRKLERLASEAPPAEVDRHAVHRTKMALVRGQMTAAGASGPRNDDRGW
ncbi:MAG: hypothetical protein PHS73_02485 [Candidatus Peribacteraceae bacterium]|nr:hypothetical protein [Candidatus Peribacteraceae bacterium]